MASSSSSSSEDQKQQEQQPQQQQECLYKTKIIQFLGRTTPIVLQNDNGPCPLLAICNVLLLRNNLNLSPDAAEVSQEKLLSLVAERLIDSNSNVNNKDAGFVENQQQNISDAIDLLPRLATGIDVNIKFRRIDDFEFTPECAIFDLLDIPLHHGWLVDPQDYDTAIAIGLKSYNALTGELVALETKNMDGECNNKTEEESVDFAAATTAILGVPSPCLSKASSFDDSPRSVPEHQKARKGDLEEEAELLRVMKLSEAGLPTSVNDFVITSVYEGTNSVNLDESIFPEKVMPQGSVDTLDGRTSVEKQNFHLPEPSTSVVCNALNNDNNDLICFKTISGEASSPFFLKADGENHLDQSTYVQSAECILRSSADTLVQMESALYRPRKDVASLDESHVDISCGVDKIQDQSISTNGVDEPADNHSGRDTTEISCLSGPNADSDLSSGGRQHTGVPEAYTSKVDGSEPIYEGEECILDSGATNFENREPIYEGEGILAEQADKSTIKAINVKSKDEITPQQGELIRNFLKNNASQLTFYGLFCLQDGLKERQLCVFFRNNHFSTMFKYDGELYLLATDQGYINQPDLVWEKLNEVNGDTLFMTGNFKEFKVDSHTNDAWDENNALTSTADYLASIDSAAHAGLDVNSDLQLAIALQQQEFDQQPQRHNLQQPSTTGSSRLITGPQVSRNSGRTSSSSSRADAKSKEKCTMM